MEEESVLRLCNSPNLCSLFIHSVLSSWSLDFSLRLIFSSCCLTAFSRSGVYWSTSCTATAHEQLLKLYVGGSGTPVDTVYISV